ncbi:MAG: ATP-binding cassette domain-containing protein [Deinococcales bacterium]|jgi:oligopeptide/dipeptide ABC transporter ATP-binding protein
MTQGESLLEVTDVSHRYATANKRPGAGHWALTDVSLKLRPEETLGVIGETGSGKSTIGMIAVGQIAPTQGEVVLNGKPFAEAWEPGRVQMVFQDPVSSLDPRMSVQDILTEPLRAAGIGTPAEQRERARALIERVGLNPEHLGRRRAEFSGGQCQRIAIARAIITQPDFVVLDEPTSSLDVIVQAKILNLLQDIKDEFKTAFIFISHNLAVVEAVADRVVVLYRGHVVEEGPADEVFASPSHPYTQNLARAILGIRDVLERDSILGEAAAPKLDAAPPSRGCIYAPLCPLREAVCEQTAPSLAPIGRGRSVSCHVAARGEAGVAEARANGTQAAAGGASGAKTGASGAGAGASETGPDASGAGAEAPEEEVQAPRSGGRRS